MKRITLLGTSGVGKTTLSALLEREGWYHYSGDYRIAMNYLHQALRNWLQELVKDIEPLSELLVDNSIKVHPNVSIDNLSIVSRYIDKLGRGGLNLHTFQARQKAFARAEINAMLDVPDFIVKSRQQGYERFINDAGGSVGEIDDAAIFEMLKAHTLIIYIHADEGLQQELLSRALKYPKPICYHPQFLAEMIALYQSSHDGISANEFDSDDFIRFVTPKMLAHRRARYQEIAKRYGVQVDAKEVWQVRDSKDFTELVAQAIRKKTIKNKLD